MLSVSLISSAEYGTDFYEILLKFVTREHDTVIRFNFLVSNSNMAYGRTDFGAKVVTSDIRL